VTHGDHMSGAISPPYRSTWPGHVLPIGATPFRAACPRWWAYPLVTRSRPLFLSQAIKCFLRQTYHNKELITVDDSEASVAALVPADAALTYIKLEAPLTFGSQLNLGIDATSGQIIQKLDDDDHYHSSSGLLADYHPGALGT
jgi:hypothetical protein